MIAKGTQKVVSLSEAQVAEALDPDELLRELEASFGALARGEVQCPPRPAIAVPGKGFSLAMAAWQPGMHICVKVANVFDADAVARRGVTRRRNEMRILREWAHRLLETLHSRRRDGSNWRMLASPELLPEARIEAAAIRGR